MKKHIRSSQPEKLVRASESAMRKPLNKKQGEELQQIAAMPDSEIDFSDAPDTGDLSVKPIKRPIAMEIDSDVLAWLRSKPGYQTRVNHILRHAMAAARK